ncbi:MAG: pectinesterase family protein [Prevotella sp.]
MLPFVAKAQGDVTVSSIQEKCLYSTNFTEWGAYETSAKTTETKVTWQTKYSHEDLTFSIFNTQIGASNWNTGKFPDWEGGFLMANKSADPYIVTSPLASVTKVHYIHGATGSNRGWKLEAKGDGDEDWVVISDAVANPATGSEVNAEVNRTNVQLRWTNLNASQNAYMMQIDIYGNVDFSKSPSLGEFEVNGTKYAADDVFNEQADGTMTATVEISKKETMISEANPLANLTTNNGDITSTTYSTDAEGNALVTIKVKAGEEELTYVLTVVFKPDFTLTYYGVSGDVLGTQIVEKDATIGIFSCEYSEELPTSFVFRGWYAAAEGGRRYASDDVVTSDLSLYALVTKNESIISGDERYYYNLADKHFYADAHEAFNPEGKAEFYDGTHGWVFSTGDKLNLLVGGHAYINLGLCKFSAGNITMSDATGTELGSIAAKVETDGQSGSFEYNGEATTLTLTFSGTTYIHNVTIINDANSIIKKNDNGYFIVKAGDASNLLATLEIANAQANNDSRTFIFVPNGTYDLGKTCLTKVSGNNISIIGESMEGTIIKNAPDVEGIGTTATLLVTGQNTYFQDLTLQNALDYYSAGNAGRAVCLQDKGGRTICKNVRMLSYQDTYYSNTNSQFYWETSEIHGTVDFICGGGDVYFNKCLLVGESRSATGKSGDVTLTAPYTDASNTYGYVFEGCTIENRASTFNFGRAWGGVARLAFLNTTLNQPNEIAAKRFTAAGMNVTADKFVEYNSVDKDGNVVSPASNVVTFTKDSQQKTMETIITAEEAAEYSLDKVFPDWKPAALAQQTTVGAVSLTDNTLTWEAAQGATAYAVVCNDEIADIVDAGTTSYAVSDANATYAVRAANGMGGFGDAIKVGEAGTNIKNAVNDYEQETVIHTLGGVRINKADGKGIYIINGKKKTN